MTFLNDSQNSTGPSGEDGLAGFSLPIRNRHLLALDLVIWLVAYLLEAIPFLRTDYLVVIRRPENHHA